MSLWGPAITAVTSLVVACYRHLCSCVGGFTDRAALQHELQRTWEWALELVVVNWQEPELLLVTFSSSLELLHDDKVFKMVQS
ncbi:hypothetical protein AAFF_G00439080 [Aldrovandia affinis]|uniref:Secreted protein n=1 Tax=Aldrovandia affinis TaxID=143900 RepID=A0AAD7S7I4_9TELE|nr:hypothetical protein AAFF_G00439080 [Aldrovandia affinis]